MQLDPVAKILIFLGAALILCGVLWQLGWLQALRIGRLPGDIAIERENFRFYFPITTMILLSAIIGLVRWLLQK